MNEFELLTVVVESDASGLEAPDVWDGHSSALGKIQPASRTRARSARIAIVTCLFE
jgi:hypothetical protein